jgi:hypothetical protein
MRAVVRHYVNNTPCTLKAFHDEWEILEFRESAEELAAHINRIQENYERAMHRVAQLEQGAELKEATHIMMELHGVIVEYQQLPCKSLEDRMFSTAQRYGKRLFEIARRVREQTS